jgi:protein TonB
MFEQSLFDTSWQQRSRRSWTTLLSFTAQAFAVGMLLLAPILYSAGPPSFEFIQRLIVPPAAPAPPAPHSQLQQHPATESNLNAAGQTVTPPSIPPHAVQIEDQAPPIRLGDSFGVQGGTGDMASAATNAVLNSIASSTRGITPTLPVVPVARPIVTSHAMEAYLIHRVQPEYPALARTARIQGEVVLRAIISSTGSIENLHVLSGHPMLVASAVNAVLQWRYRPYVLNGNPVEVETQVTVRFILSQ